jgi:hypothetical protein
MVTLPFIATPAPTSKSRAIEGKRAKRRSAKPDVHTHPDRRVGLTKDQGFGQASERLRAAAAAAVTEWGDACPHRASTVA